MPSCANSLAFFADFSGRLVHARPVIVIFGHRTYGAVDEQGGEYAVTKFAHVYYLPIFPTGSVWMTGPETGIPTPLNFKSIAAGYLRTWGLGLGVLCFVLGLTGLNVLLALLGLISASVSISTWKWRKRTS